MVNLRRQMNGCEEICSKREQLFLTEKKKKIGKNLLQNFLLPQKIDSVRTKKSNLANSQNILK